MKKHYIIILFAFIVLSVKINAQIVNIPDANFKAALIASGVHDSAGYITLDTAKAFKDTLYVGNYNIYDLNGIQAFTALTGLNCDSNHLTDLAFAANKALTYLDCSYNYSIESLYLSDNKALTYLNCNSNNLAGLDISSNTALTYLDCSLNFPLTSLDVSSNTTLTYLDLGGDAVTSLNVTRNKSLIYLECAWNSLTSLNVLSNTNLTYLGCANIGLTSLDVSSNTNLTILSCLGNNLSSLNVSSNTALISLYCYNNYLASLDLSSNKALSYLDCNSNNLTSLDLSSNAALTFLGCPYNILTSLNVKNGNNHNMTGNSFYAVNNPLLTCIQVDDSSYSKTNWTIVDPQEYFSTDCNYVGINEMTDITDVSLYPNPVNSEVTIETHGLKAVSIKIFDMLGQLNDSYNLTGNRLTIDMNKAPAGIYTIQITDDNKNIINKKIIKQ